jgi:hypothetical protein
MPIGRHGIGAGVVGDTIFVIGGAPNQGFGLTDVNQGFIPPASIITGVPTNGVTGSDFEVVIYPNPASVFVTVRVVADQSGFATVVLTDVLGRVLRTVRTGVTAQKRTEIRLNIAGLPSGVYLARTDLSAAQHAVNGPPFGTTLRAVVIAR